MTQFETFSEEASLVVGLGDVGFYVLHHTWESGADTWIDGRIVFYNGDATKQLDVACSADASLSAAKSQDGLVAWEAGTVHSFTPSGGVATLVVPGETLSTASVVEALNRFRL